MSQLNIVSNEGNGTMGGGVKLIETMSHNMQFFLTASLIPGQYEEVLNLHRCHSFDLVC